MNIVAEYSLWFIPVCILFGLGASIVLYRNDAKLAHVSLRIRKLLFILRATLVALLCFLLLAPFVERTVQDIKKPVLVFLQDNSASVMFHKDSAYYASEYLQQVDAFVKKLESDYQVDRYTFGARLFVDSAIRYTQQETNISQALQDISTRYYNANLGAVVMVSDGIYTAGQNPQYSLQHLNAPLYTIRLGDTVQGRDNVITDVLHNKIAFRNTPFRIKIQIESHALQGKTSKLQVFESSRKVIESSILANNDNFFTEVEMRLSSSEVGQKMYKVVLESHEGEKSYKNNEFTFVVDVLESKQRVLLLYEAVHPDIAALRRAIEGNANFAVDVYSAKFFVGNIADYNCVILHGMPSAYGKGKELAQKVIDAKIPSLFVYNTTMNMPVFQSFGVGVDVRIQAPNADEAQVMFSQTESLFDIDADLRTFLESAPPLLVPYASYTVNVAAKVFAHQKIQGIPTTKPLIVFYEYQGVKFASILGEGLWRWRIHNYRRHQSFEYFDVFVNKIVSFLALNQKRSLFSVQTKPVFSDNQPIDFRAELYNKSFEPVMQSTISLTIRDEQAREYPFVFVPGNGIYTLQAGMFAPGEYTYHAKAELDGEQFVENGKFIVVPLHIEYKQTQANHSLLRDLSRQTMAQSFLPHEFDALYESVMSNKDIVSISYTTKKRSLLLDLPFILILLIVFASLEWFLRKYYGSY